MNTSTVNIVYNSNNYAVLDYENKTSNIIGKGDIENCRQNSPTYECFVKNKLLIRNSACYIYKHDNNDGPQMENSQKVNKSDKAVLGPENKNRSLRLYSKKKANVLKLKLKSLQKEYTEIEFNNSLSCLISDQRRLMSSRNLRIAHNDGKNDQLQLFCKINSFSLSSCIFGSLIPYHLSFINKMTPESKHVTPTSAFKKESKFPDNEKDFLCTKTQNRCYRLHKHHRRSYISAILNYVTLTMSCSYLLPHKRSTFNTLILILLILTRYIGPLQSHKVSRSLPVASTTAFAYTDYENTSDILVYKSTDGNSGSNARSSTNNKFTKNSINMKYHGSDRVEKYFPANRTLILTPTDDSITSGGYLDKLDNLERSLAAVLIKVAYGTTSTTKRSISEQSYAPRLTTIATPLLTTLRYQEKSHQSQLNLHHRNYELDLERDHALPTSAPNADILKSNSNPTYPNPNRYHNEERDRHRHLVNSTPKPLMPNKFKKTSGQMSTISMLPGSGEIPSYSPPSRSFFTPPLPPEYQHPFADKPTLRGTNNEGEVESHAGSYINRRPIPPPSLMPGHERIPFRPPDIGGTEIFNNNEGISSILTPSLSSNTTTSVYSLTTMSAHMDNDVKLKALNTPPKITSINSENVLHVDRGNLSYFGIYLAKNNSIIYNNSNNLEVRKEVLPSIRRILSGSNGRKGDIPEVLLKQVTTRPNNNYHYPPSSPVVLIETSLLANEGSIYMDNNDKQNINKIKNVKDSDSIASTKPLGKTNFASNNITSTPSAAAANVNKEKSEINITASVFTSTTSSSLDYSPSVGKNYDKDASFSSSSISSSTSSSTLSSASIHATWSLAWNIHVYLSVILFTILAVYSFYKMITYNKLTHLFSQSYFICIHIILIIICTTRIFYLCYDAYNIHSSFHMFISEILLNLPATFLTISFAVLMLFLFLKSLNQKNNRYSALIRPLTVVVGCGVHVILCITLHYVESYTLQNHQHHFYYQQQQQQQLLTKRQHMHQQQNLLYNYLQNQYSYAGNIIGLQTMAFSSSSTSSIQGANINQHTIGTSISSMPPPPPRVLSLICQIIYIFVCLSLGLLYLYLYRILKRILRCKSQNYIHGYQNLSYAIHITIATALLFVLLASLQIFGALSISSSRPLITQKTAEIDWIQWGYQFSLRLIEIAIITLISWVTRLKTTTHNNTVNINLANNDSRAVIGAQVNNANSMFNTNHSVNSVRDKHSVHNSQCNRSNMTNFFLPCTSSSSQEQFDADYPAVCNANTNLHTYTMRTGKLIYDDSFVLNAMNSTNVNVPVTGFHHHPQSKQNATYQHPYDSQAVQSSAHHNASKHGSRINFQPENHMHYNHYLTDNTTDHYENPNFDLRGSGSATSGSALVVNSHAGTNRNIQKDANNFISNTTTTASSSNTNSHMDSNSSGSSGSFVTMQQQILLFHGCGGGGGDTSYSEPIQESFDFNNFEKPNFKQHPHDNWPEAHKAVILNQDEKKKSLTILQTCGYDKTEGRSSNSTHSCNSNSNCSSSNINGIKSGAVCESRSRYASFNTFERASFNNLHKSDTLNNITTSKGINIMHGRNHSSSSTTSATSDTGTRNTSFGLQPLVLTERHHQQHHILSSRNLRSKILKNNATLDVFERSTLENSSINHAQQSPPLSQSSHAEQQQYSDDDDDDDKDEDIMLAASPHQV